MRRYKTILRPTTLNKKSRENLFKWERNILRRILGGQKTEDDYVRRNNEEIYGNIQKSAVVRAFKNKNKTNNME